MTKRRSCSQEDLWLGIFPSLPPSQEVTECLRASRMSETSGSTDATDLPSFGEEEDDESARLKEYFSWWDPVKTRMSVETSRLVQRRNAFKTEPADALALRRILSQA